MSKESGEKGTLAVEGRDWRQVEGRGETDLRVGVLRMGRLGRFGVDWEVAKVWTGCWIAESELRGCGGRGDGARGVGEMARGLIRGAASRL